MDKYEYNIKLDQIKVLLQDGKKEEAAEIADSINWNKIKNVNALVKAGEVYEKVGRYEDSRDILLNAYDRSPIGRTIIYRLAEVAIKMKDFEAAQEYYDEFVDIAPHDNQRYILKYNIKKAQDAPNEELIPILEEFKEQEYTEEWAYELAYLYHKTGLIEKCIDACDELILWFGDGLYVERALELKMLYQPLTKAQEDKYNQFCHEKEGKTFIRSDEMERAGEIGHESVIIPKVTLNPSRFNTVNLQKEIVKGIQQIMDATEKETVVGTMDNIKKIAEEIPYLQLPTEEELAEKERAANIATDEEIDHTLKLNFQELLGEDADGQLSLLVREKAMLERQITGQITISEVLEDWEKTKRAAELVLQEAEQKKLESAKARALQEAEDIMVRLNDVIPKIEAIVKDNTKIEETGLLFESVNSILDEEIERLNTENIEIENHIQEVMNQENKLMNQSTIPMPKIDDIKYEIPIIEESIIETQSTEEVFVEEPVLEIPDISDIYIKEPVLETPDIKDIFVEEPVLEIPDISDIYIKEPVLETPDIHDIFVEEPVLEIPDIKDIYTEESVFEPFNENFIVREDASLEDVLVDKVLVQDKVQLESEKTQEQEKEILPEKDALALEIQRRILEDHTVRIPKIELVEPELFEEEIKEKQIPFEGRKLRALTDEQKAIFSYFVPIKGMERQLCKALAGMITNLNGTANSSTGNLIIQGSQGCGKTVLATSIIKVLQKECGRPNGKIGKIDAESLNKKDVRQLLQKVEGGCLIIERAGAMNKNTAIKLSLLLEQNTSGLFVILEDSAVGIKKVMSMDEGFAKKFTESVTVPIFSNDDLVIFAKSYANELGYEIDEMAILALHNSISNIEKYEQATTLEEVKEIIDDAIEREAHSGLRKYFNILTANRYTDDEKIVLTEKDFE